MVQWRQAATVEAVLDLLHPVWFFQRWEAYSAMPDRDLLVEIEENVILIVGRDNWQVLFEKAP